MLIPTKSPRLTLFVLFVFCLLLMIGLWAAIAPFSALDVFPHTRGGIPPLPTDSWYGRVVSHVRIWGVIVVAVSLLGLVAHRKIVQYLNILLESVAYVSRKTRLALTRFSQEDRFHLFALILLVLIGVAIRVYAVRTVILQNDEALTYTDFVSTPLYALISNYRQPNNHILHNILAQVAVTLFGNEVWVLRLPAVTAGILIIPALYAVGRRLYNKHTALLMAALVVPAESLIMYSAQARGYTMIVLSFLLLILIASYLIHNRSAALWATFAVIGALGAFTIPVMLYPFGVVALWLLAEIGLQTRGVERSQLLRDFVVTMIAVGVLTLGLYSFAIVISGIRSLVQNSYVLPRSWPDFLSSIPPFAATIWAMFNGSTPPIVILILILGVVTSLVLHSRVSRYKVPLLLPLVLWCGGLMLAQRNTPFARVWLFMIPIYFLASAAGFVGLLDVLSKRLISAYPDLTRRVIPVAAIVLAGAFSFVVLSSHVIESGTIIDSLTYPDAEQVGVYLAKNVRSTDQIMMVFPTYGVTNYYYLKNGGSFSQTMSGVDLTKYPQASRILIVTMPQITPIEKIVNATLRDGTPIAPMLVYDTPTARVYEVVPRNRP